MHHHHHLLSEEERPVAATRTYYKRERGEREMNVFFFGVFAENVKNV
tara:strand:+ start:3588 stop:3728 length:141 start_codon:yes stop_codon:yes gene_type:complete